MPEADARPGTAAFVREHLGRMEYGDIVQGISDYAEDAVLEVALVGEAASILNGTFRGREAIGRWIDSWFSSFERGSYRFKVEESIENGDRVYMALDHTARGEASGVEATLRTHHAFTVRDGLIVRHALSGEREPMLRETARV
jgi:ketosteroid isomerase-like protein